MLFLATSVDVNVFKLSEGFCACVKLLNDLFCAEIAEFLLGILTVINFVVTFNCFSRKCGGFFNLPLSNYLCQWMSLSRARFLEVTLFLESNSRILFIVLFQLKRNYLLPYARVNITQLSVLEITSSPNTSHVSISFILHKAHNKSRPSLNTFTLYSKKSKNTNHLLL